MTRAAQRAPHAIHADATHRCPVCDGDGRMYYQTERGPWSIECHWCGGSGTYVPHHNPRGAKTAAQATARVAESQRKARADIKPRLAALAPSGSDDASNRREFTLVCNGDEDLVDEAQAREDKDFPSAFAYAGPVIRRSRPMTIGKHQWRLTLYRDRTYGVLIGYEWRPCAPTWAPHHLEYWKRDVDWPRYDHNDGMYAGMPRTLRKLWETCPWAHPGHPFRDQAHIDAIPTAPASTAPTPR